MLLDFLALSVLMNPYFVILSNAFDIHLFAQVFGASNDFPGCIWKLENWLNAVVYILTVICVSEIVRYNLVSRSMIKGVSI